jgi:hypothetical protein
VGSPPAQSAMPRRYELLLEVGQERPAQPDGRPACSPTWTNPLSKDGPPQLPGIQTLYDSFRQVDGVWASLVFCLPICSLHPA